MTLTKHDAFPENPPLILLVEDNIIALKLVETIVVQSGCHHLSAINGEQALELAKTIDFRLIITDIGLPGISGTELTSQIREWEQSLNKKPTPIIGLTAHTLHASKSKCLQAGMDKVLTKPIYLDEMQDLVLQFIKKNTSTLSEELKSELKTYALDQFPLFDHIEGMKNIGDERVLRDLLILLISKAIPEDLVSLEMAYKNQDWSKIEDLAHKIKSGALYCGTKKMEYACLYLERYPKNGSPDLLEKLYQQLIVAVSETKHFVEKWLEATQG